MTNYFKKVEVGLNTKREVVFIDFGDEYRIYRTETDVFDPSVVQFWQHLDVLYRKR
jgi:hypothetical protein